MQYLDKVFDVFFVQFIDGVDVPVIMQRQVVSRTVEVPQIQFIARVGGHSSSQQRWALGFQQGVMGVFAVFPHFSRSSGLSRS